MNGTLLLSSTACTSLLRRNANRFELNLSLIPSSSRRFKAIAKKHGYSYENGKVARDEEDAITGNGATETPEKAKGKRGPKAKAIPTPKKRKLFDATAKDVEDIVETDSYVTVVSAGEENKTNSDEKDIGEDVDEEIRNDNGDYQARAQGVKQKSDGGYNEETAEELA